jgi:hypothetical protein
VAHVRVRDGAQHRLEHAEKSGAEDSRPGTAVPGGQISARKKAQREHADDRSHQPAHGVTLTTDPPPATAGLPSIGEAVLVAASVTE